MPNKTTQSKNWEKKTVFTTGEAAKVCTISQQTIIRCFDSGRLTGFRVPGSRFRRIPRDELVRFMKANDIPTDILEGPTKRILLVDDDNQIIDLLVDLLSRDDRFTVETAETAFEAGFLTQSFKPNLILFDYMLPDIDGSVLCDLVREDSDLSDTMIIIVSGMVDQGLINRLLEKGVDKFVKKPINIEQLVAQISEMLEV